MKITVAKTAGFCFGVRNAIQIAQKESQKSDQPIYTYGPLIHNRDVIERLEEQGIYALDMDSNAQASDQTVLQPGSRVVIRAHGVGEAVYEALRAQ